MLIGKEVGSTALNPAPSATFCRARGQAAGRDETLKVDAMQIRKFAQDDVGSIVISVLLGLGLAAMFRTACRGDGCVIIKSPNLQDVQSRTFRVSRDECYQYTPEVVPCPLTRASVAPQL